MSISCSRHIVCPQLEVSVLAHTGDELCRLRGRNGPNRPGVAAQHPGFGPGIRVPEADGLILGCGDQTSSVPAKREIENVGGVYVELLEKFASCGLPDVDRPIYTRR